MQIYLNLLFYVSVHLIDRHKWHIRTYTHIHVFYIRMETILIYICKMKRSSCALNFSQNQSIVWQGFLFSQYVIKLHGIYNIIFMCVCNGRRNLSFQLQSIRKKIRFNQLWNGFFILCFLLDGKSSQLKIVFTISYNWTKAKRTCKKIYARISNKWKKIAPPHTNRK